MAQLNLGAIKDLGGIGGFTFSSGGITANGTLNVQDIEITGNVSGSSGSTWRQLLRVHCVF